jgi:rare lipoprotein A
MLLLAKVVLFTIATTALSHPLTALTPSISLPALPHVTWHHGHASWYGPRFFQRPRKDGTRYLKNDVFVAHQTYPIGTVLRMVNLRNKRSIEVTVRDRVPQRAQCEFDLSLRAGEMLGMLRDGVVPVAYQVIRR